MADLPRYSMFIDGAWAEAEDGAVFESFNPATGEPWALIPEATAGDVDRAVRAADRAFSDGPWARATASERGRLLRRLGDLLADRSEALGRIETIDTGKMLKETRWQARYIAEFIHFYAGAADKLTGETLPIDKPDLLVFTAREPLGVVAAVVPWNSQLFLSAVKLGPALAAGNTVVLKPSSVTPLSTLMLAEVFDHLPAGTVNIVTGAGEAVGDALVTHPQAPVIAFTGSTAVGQRIASLAAPMMKKLHLELGGKDAFLVAEDADLDVAVVGVAWAALLNNGQVCTSTERIYVHERLYSDFVALMAEYVQGLVLGDPLDPATDLGPMAGAEYRAKVERQVADAVQRGARLLAGGQRPPDRPRGYFYEPTVLVDLQPEMAVMREETFGPVLPIGRFATFDEAIALANDSVYGLGANLYTNNAAYVKRFYEEVRAGTLWINDPLTDNDAGPFGGFGQSGIGRELGEEGLDEFRQTKHVHWDFAMERKAWWYPYEQYNRER